MDALFKAAFLMIALLCVGCVSGTHSIKVLDQNGQAATGQNVKVTYLGVYPLGGRPKTASVLTDDAGVAKIVVEDAEKAVVSIGGGSIPFNLLVEGSGVECDVYRTDEQGQKKTGFRAKLIKEPPP